MNFVNLVPHDVVIYDDAGENVVKTIPYSGIVARVSEETVKESRIGRFRNRKKVYASLIFIDRETKQEVDYTISKDAVNIVSEKCFEAIEASLLGSVFITPDTQEGSVVRNEKGWMLGVRGFKYR